MQNNSLTPFIRNQYYSGKSLTASGLAAEQRYFNDKRRLANLACAGAGVVFGLTVTKLDGRSIIIDSGLAIDALGREIVLSGQTVVQLSDLDGFDDDDGSQSVVYLCIEYAEEDLSPLHAMADPSAAQDRYDLKRESYRLFLRYGEPDGEEFAGASQQSAPTALEAPAADTPAPSSASPEALERAYREEGLDARLERGMKERLYLARISIVRWKEAYDVDGIQQVPFGQYAASAALLAQLYHALAHAAAKPTFEGALPPSDQVPSGDQPLVAHGMAELEIPPDTLPNAVLQTPVITHGLGLVGVHIELALEFDGGAIFGSSAVFAESRGYEYAACSNERAGTFRIAVWVRTANPVERLRFRWRAEANPAIAEYADEEQPQIVISPASPVLRVREAQQFTATVYGLNDTDVIWELRSPEHGDIMRDGYYTAPNTPGIYEVFARSAADTQISALALVTVKEYPA
jgi:hypothetical protein